MLSVFNQMSRKRNGDANNLIAVHHLYSTNIYSTNYFHCTNLKQMAPNRCRQLPAPYKRLIHNVNDQTDLI